MSFFQNVLESEFRGNLFSSDRKLQSMFNMSANRNTSVYMVSNNQSNVFDFTGVTDLTINYAYDPSLIAYATRSIDVSGAILSATTLEEVISKLNADDIFKELFSASIYPNSNQILITAKRSREYFKAYISNTGAETLLKFNAKAPVAELPEYFERYSFEKRFEYSNLGSHRLVLLDETDAIDAAIITAAGLDPLNPTPDWKLLAGSNDAYWFYKRNYAAGLITDEIKYPAGAKEGDLAKRTYYTYSGSDLIEIMETPYILTSGDLITPP